MFLYGYNRSKIFIDHPNNIFTKKIITENNNIINEIDWDSIDFFKMLKVEKQQQLDHMPLTGDYYYFKYCIEKIKTEISTLVKKGREKEAIRYLTVVQKNSTGDYLVRGIIKGTYDEGFFIAFNEKYLETMPYGFINDYNSMISNDQEISSNTPVKKI